MAFDYDVAIIGGAFSGGATALMLKGKHPAARVLIIEKTTEFDRKVGESTTEVRRWVRLELENLILLTFSRGRHPAGSSAETPAVACKI
jgi:glycine/D-amino acid oxidase-like deaminating enzyme